MRFLKPAVLASGTADCITDNNAKAGDMSMKQVRIKLIKQTIERENFADLRGSTQAMFSPSHPMILEAIAAGLEPFIFSESSKDVSIAADQNKSTPGDFRNLLGE